VNSGEPNLEGRRLADRYVLEEELASGGMGGLWLARDEVLGRQVAVKVLHDHLARDEDLLERFRIEAVAAARLSHPSVVRVFDTGIDDGVCFIVMELVEGQTVAELLKERGALAPSEATAIMRGVLSGLTHAHRGGVIHRDVKPGNILVGRGDLVKLADFGIAKAAFAQGDVTTTGNLLGTSRYVSPEQVTGGEVDERSDLYSAGVVLYELLTGRPPFDAETHIATATMRLTTDPPPPRSLRPGIPRGVEAAVMKSLAREPDDRFQTAEEMSAALEHATPGTARQTREIPRQAPPRQRRALLRSWLAIPIVLLVAGGLAVGGFLLLEGFGTREPPPSAAQPPQGSPIDISNAYAFDPSPGDAEEHDENLSNAIDGDPSTAWSTEGYRTADLGGIKEGVGLVLQLNDPAEIGGIAIETELGGWTFTAYAGDGPDSFDTAASLGEFQAEDGASYAIDPTETGYLLVWITNLVPDGAGDYRATVNEIELLPPGD
jgi:eukaryotic-like serine/threonine-protein kinase